MTDNQYMQMALDLSQKGRASVSPNPMVGAIIVKNNRIVGRGYHRKFGGTHAEINAIKNAQSKARGATLYVTLEPCFHFGKTPPCVDAVIKSGIKRVVIAQRDPNPLTTGKSIAKLKRSKISVKCNVLKAEAESLNVSFNTLMKTKKPFVVAKVAQTLDGKIATKNGHSKWITSKKTREYAHKIRDEFDAICVGFNTVVKDNPRLNGHSKIKKIKKVILDSRLRISFTANIFKGCKPDQIIVATTLLAGQPKIKKFIDKGINVIVYPKRTRKIPKKWLLEQLGSMGIASLLIEGGAHTIGAAFKEGVIDRLHIYMAPKIIGDEKALSSIVGMMAKTIQQTIRLHNLTLTQIDKDIFIKANVHRTR